MQPTLSGQPCLLQQGTVLRPWSLRVRIAKHLSGPRRDSDHHHHRGCACLSPLPWATLSLAVAVEVGHDCAYPILQAGKLRQGQAQGPAHAREEAASWVEVAEVAQGHPASHVATPPSFQMQTSGGSGLNNGHRAGWMLGAHVRCWPCAGEPRRGRGPVCRPPRLHSATGAWRSSSGRRRHAGPPRLTSSVNRHLTAATPKQESSPGLRVGVAASCRAAWQAVSALPLDWGRLSEAQRAPLTAGLQIEKHPGHPPSSCASPRVAASLTARGEASPASRIRLCSPVGKGRARWGGGHRVFVLLGSADRDVPSAGPRPPFLFCWREPVLPPANPPEAPRECANTCGRSRR